MSDQDLDDHAATDLADPGPEARLPRGGRPDRDERLPGGLLRRHRQQRARIGGPLGRSVGGAVDRGPIGRGVGRGIGGGVGTSTSSPSSSCTTGATTSPRRTSRRSRRSTASTKFTVRHLRQQRGADGQAPGRGDRRTTSPRRPRSSCPGWSRRASSRSSTSRRIPNVKYIDQTFKNLWWDPTNEYQVPKDYGTTGILYRSTKIVKEPISRGRSSTTSSRAKYSGKIVFVDSLGDVFVVPAQDARLLAQLGRPDGARPGAHDPARRRPARPGPRLGQVRPEADRRRGGPAPRLDRPCSCAGAPEGHADTVYVIPSDGTLFWLDTWVMITDAPHPNAAYAWLELHPRPRRPGQGDRTTTSTPRRTTRPRSSSTPEILNDPAVFPPEDVHRQARGRQDTSGNTHRIDIWEEFKSKIGKLTPG